MSVSTDYTTEILDSTEFSPQKTKLLQLLCEGLQDKSIAREMGITDKTVEHYLHELYLQVQLNNSVMNRRCRLIGIAFKNKIIGIKD